MIHLSGAAEEPTAVREHRSHEQVDNVAVVSEACSFEERLSEGNHARLTLGDTESQQKLPALTALRVGGVVDELEGSAIPTDGFVGCRLGQGAVAGELGVVEGLAGVGRGDGVCPVVGELAGPPARIGPDGGLDGFGHGPVRARAPGGGE